MILYTKLGDDFQSLANAGYIILIRFSKRNGWNQTLIEVKHGYYYIFIITNIQMYNSKIKFE